MSQFASEIDARAQIEDCVKRFARGADRLDKEMMISAFHEDAWDDHGMFAGKPSDLADWVIQVHLEFQFTAHYLSNHMAWINGDKAGSETYVQAIFRFERDGKLFDMQGNGRCIDRFECRGDIWRISERLAVADWNRIDPVAELPRGDLVLKLTTGTRDRQDPSYKLLGL
jgi:hypothetical protein